MSHNPAMSTTDKFELHYRQQLSALVDGELSADESRFLLRRLAHDEELAGCHERWQLCGDVLRGAASAPAPLDFAARVRSAIADEPAPQAQPAARPGARWRWGGARRLLPRSRRSHCSWRASVYPKPPHLLPTRRCTPARRSVRRPRSNRRLPLRRRRRPPRFRARLTRSLHWLPLFLPLRWPPPAAARQRVISKSHAAPPRASNRRRPAWSPRHHRHRCQRRLQPQWR